MRFYPVNIISNVQDENHLGDGIRYDLSEHNEAMQKLIFGEQFLKDFFRNKPLVGEQTLVDFASNLPLENFLSLIQKATNNADPITIDRLKALIQKSHLTGSDKKTHQKTLDQWSNPDSLNSKKAFITYLLTPTSDLSFLYNSDTQKLKETFSFDEVSLITLPNSLPWIYSTTPQSFISP